MLIREALRTWLLEQTAITNIVGTNIFEPGQLQKITGPYLTLQKIDAPRVESHEGNSHLAYPRFQFSVFATTITQCDEILAALQGVLQGYKGTMGGEGGVAVGGAFYEDETDLERSGQGLYGVAADYIIWHSE